MTTLAINGGTPIYTGTFPSWPQWGTKEEENLNKVLDSHSWGTLGPFAMNLAKRFGDYVGAAHAIAVNNGTQALELILRGAGIGRGDEVIVPPYTFAATVSAPAYIGAVPVFADIDERTGCIDAESVEKHITARTKAVIAVHVGGRPCDIDALKAVTQKHGILLIEDAAHAHGSAWKGCRCGSLGDAAAFSFQRSKVMPAGEGGMITTSNEELFERCWQFHHSGRVMGGRESITETTLMGTNGRMAEWQAAVLDAQMDRLEEQNATRYNTIKYVTECIRNTKGIVLHRDDDRITAMSGLTFTFQWKGQASREDFVKALCAEGIPCSNGYVLMTGMGMLTDPAFEKVTGCKFTQNDPMPNAESLSKTSVCINNTVLLAGGEVPAKIAEAINKVANNL